MPGADPSAHGLGDRARLPRADRARAAVGEPDGARRARLDLHARTRWCWPPARTTAPCRSPAGTCPACSPAGAAQALAKGERVAVGDAGRRRRRRTVPAAGRRVAAADRVAQVLGVLRGQPVRAGWRAAGCRGRGSCCRRAGKAGELAGYVGVTCAGTGSRTGRAARSSPPTAPTAVESVTVARLDADWSPIAGTERRVAVDAVCVSHGFTPRLELADRRRLRARRDGFVARRRRPAHQRAGRLRRRRDHRHRRRRPRPWPRVPSPAHCAAGGDAGRPGARAAVRRRDAVPRLRRAGSRRAHGIRPRLDGLARPTTPSSAAARRSPYGAPARGPPRPPARRPALAEAHHPRRPRHLPGPHLRPHRRGAARRADRAGGDYRPTAHHRPPADRRARSGSANSPPPTTRHRRRHRPSGEGHRND